MSADQRSLTADAIDEIGTDFLEREPPFDEFTAPERSVLEEIDWPHRESRLRFLTFGAALDYQRDATLHWQEMATLYDEHLELFSPLEARSIGQEEIQSLFEDYRIRFPNRDGRTWSTIASSIYHDYDNSVSKMIADHNRQAPRLYRTVRRDNFPFLGGDKIAPFWIRLIHEHGIELRNLDDVPIAVDAQVRRATQALEPAIEDDDEIRQYWKEICADSQFDPLELDEAIWLIGRDFDEWGQEYLDATIEKTDG